MLDEEMALAKFKRLQVSGAVWIVLWTWMLAVRPRTYTTHGCPYVRSVFEIVLLQSAVG